MKELTRLQDEAIDRLQNYAKEYDDNNRSRQYLDTLSYLISKEFLIERVTDYLYIDNTEQLLFEHDEPLPQPGIQVGHSYLGVPDIEDAYMLGIVRALVETKEQIKRKDDAM